MKRICIVGAGNIGIAIAVDLSLKTKYQILLLTRQSTQKSFNLKKSLMGGGSSNFYGCYFQRLDDNKTIQSNFVYVTHDANLAFEWADIIIITLPSFLIENFVNKITPYNPKIILFVPGFGGKEMFSKPLLDKHITIAGLERVPYIARLSSPQVVFASKKESIACGVMNNKSEYICAILEELFDIPCKAVDNYLHISFTPSNPILHTARLYALFKDCTFATTFPKQIKFYGSWNDFSSQILIDLDKELEQIARYFGVEFTTIRTHYNANSVESMTKKITSIKSLNHIDSPLKRQDSVFVIDKDSRYFIEDFPYGLCILRGFADIAEIKTPTMDRVLRWYENLFGLHYFDESGRFCGGDLAKSGIPQRFGLKTLRSIKQFYSSYKIGGGGRSTS